jgi:Family of unknown function (DUF5681)
MSGRPWIGWIIRNEWSSSVNKKGSKSSNDYVVGKGRPPVSTRFKPGQSGNPRGRPKGAKNLVAYFSEALKRKVSVKEGGRIREVTKLEGIAVTTVDRALKGDYRVLPTIIAFEREISSIQERENLPTPTIGMSTKEAMDLFKVHLNAGKPPRGR